MSEHIATAINNAIGYLTEHPDEAAYTDSPATARMGEGLKCTVEGPDGANLTTDMPEGVGGSNSAPSPGWFLRAAMASCCATLTVMRAAQEGVTLDSLEVTVDSQSDDRGILGLADDIPAGPLSSRMHIKVSSAGTEADKLRAIVEWGHAHCPVSDAVKRAVPVSLEIETG